MAIINGFPQSLGKIELTESFVSAGIPSSNTVTTTTKHKKGLMFIAVGRLNGEATDTINASIDRGTLTLVRQDFVNFGNTGTSCAVYEVKDIPAGARITYSLNARNAYMYGSALYFVG